MDKSYDVLSTLSIRERIDIARTASNRRFGECEMRLPFNTIRLSSVVRNHSHHPRSSSARKNKKRKMAYTKTQQYRESVKPILRHQSLLDRSVKLFSSAVVLEDFDKV